MYYYTLTLIYADFSFKKISFVFKALFSNKLDPFPQISVTSKNGLVNYFGFIPIKFDAEKTNLK